MKPASKKKGNAVLKVNVPAFKFEKAHDYDKMYEEAFELGERSFDEQFKKNAPKKLIKPKESGESGKMPSLLKGDEVNKSNLRSSKLKPIDDKLTNSKLVQKQAYIQGSSSNMEWINDLKRKELIKIERPARSPQRLNESMRRTNLAQISPKRGEKPLEQSQELPESMKTKEGASKNLKDYDCWDNDLAPEQWVAKYANTPPPHGKAPIYQGGEYVWVDVELLSYDEKSGKFYIRVLQNGLLKLVNRLSIQFKDEDQGKFEERLNLTKNRQKNADQSIKLLKYIESIDDKSVAPLDKKVSQSLGQKYANTPHVFQVLLDEINNIHLNYEKKFLLLDPKNTMQIPQPIPKTEQFTNRTCPVYKRFDNFQKIAEQISKCHISSKPKQLKCEKQILQKGTQIIKKYGLLGNLTQSSTIFSLEALKERIQKQGKNSNQNWEIIWRSHIVSEIQHILKEQYRFFVTEKNAYENNPLKRVIIKFDVLFNHIIRQKMINQTIDQYLRFIKSYIPPKEGQFYKIRGSPLIILQMNVNVTSIKKKKKKSRNQKREEVVAQEEAEEVIYYEPNTDAVEEVLLMPFELLENISGRFYKIERELIPLLNLSSVASYPITKDDPVLSGPSDEIIAVVKQASKRPLQILSYFKQFTGLITTTPSSIIRKLFPDKTTMISYYDKEEIQEKLEKLWKDKTQVERIATDEVNCGLFQVRTRVAKETLVSRSVQTINEILKKINQVCLQNIKNIQKIYKERQAKLMPKDAHLMQEDELRELKKLVSENDTAMQKLKNEVDTIAEYFLILEKYLYNIDSSTEESFWGLKFLPLEIKDAVEEANRIIGERQTKLSQKLDEDKVAFNAKLIQLEKTMESIKKASNYKGVSDFFPEIQKFKQTIQDCKKDVVSFNQREEMFKQPTTTYEGLDIIESTAVPYIKMWQTAIKFYYQKQKTFSGPLLKNNFTQLEKTINKQFLKQTMELTKQFDNIGNDNASAILTQMKEDIESFREKLWLIQLLATEALIKRPIYFKQISEECKLKVKLEPNDELTLNYVIELGLDHHREKIEQISKKADKQYALEKKLGIMIQELKKLEIGVKAYPKAKTYILENIDDVQQALDDNLNALLMMKSSPHIKPILTRAITVESKIVLIQDTLENWIKTQRGWMYLEPIFSSEDIQQKMAAQKAKFDAVDKQWKTVMDQFSKQRNLWDGITSETTKNQFADSNALLDQIQKSLSDYLETKRRFFPRFYFLSDEELLEILAKTKDPETVQQYINKCFEGIGQLEMKGGIVSGMVSMEKQKVSFNKKVDVNEGQKKGNVERWLLEIEGTMIDTLKKITKTAIEDQTTRVNWVKMWPAQTVLGVNMIRWTNQAEEAIMNGTVKQYLEQLVEELKDIVKLVRTDLTELDRLTLGALVTIDVHGKDVIQSLEKQKCQNIQDFSWIAQLRYYWTPENYPKNPMPVKMINAELFYAFEYLGNSPRLVITPLTDRCYRTLMGAFHLYYGGAPEGPAGTGKTETVKDLAKALSVFCVVFNCSDGLNYIAMRKFFKGLASSGSWCCFDEFNRIDLEVLSVIAQQVLTIQSAIRARKKVFDFDGEQISLIATCAINITMNPGYAGRSELPDNLKALFRPCAMMVPDYALIAEIYLYSVGFEEARDLARKIVASLRLSSQQLSSQDHYDFGMRALKAILTAAGNLKRVMADDEEDVVCLRALMDVNIPKFTFNDVPLFSSITSDLFPKTKLPVIDYGKLKQSFVNYCHSKNLQPQEGFLSKCIQLYDTVNVRHGLMVVGAAFSGKSKVTQVLAEGMSSLAGQQSFVKVAQLKLNPKSITSDQLYGKLDPNTKSWTDGVIALIMRKCAEDAEKRERKWVVFDGPVDAVWIENMNTVLDDNKKLCLTSGQIIKLTSWMTMMFEVEDLAVASPATVSRCGMVFLETKQLGWFALVKTFVANIPQKLHKYSELLLNKIKYIVNGTLAWIRRYGKFQVHQSEMTFTSTLLKILGTFTNPYKQEQAKIQKQIEDILSNLIVFCCVWSIGAAIDETCRKGFSEFLIHLINGSAEIMPQLKLDPDYELHPVVYGCKLPEKVHMFDMYYNVQKLIWQNWSQTQPPFVIPKVSYNELIIPTNDSIRHNYFLHLNIKNHLHVLFVGPTGTGKSMNVAKELQTNYYNSYYTFLTTAFSGQTNANQIQRLIDSKVCTRRRKGCFGPESGKQQIVIFIDDLNMPQKQKFGAQPPIQLLRQWMDTGGWYDLDTKQLKFLQDINFVAAMLPPVGGRNVVTMRYLRHYNLIYVEPFDNESLNKIFGCVLEWYFNSLPQSLPKAITGLKDNIVASTLELYNKVQTSKQLLPTPAKSHYIYNLRDLSKVFQGISKATNKSFASQNDFIKLWAHECSRTFKDRLISIQDQQFFEGLLKDILKNNFKRDWNSLVTVEPLLFANFIPTIYPDGDKTRKPLNGIYCELTDRDAVKKKCHQYLEEYNNLYSANRMNLVLFTAAIEHVIKIVRVITTTFGHALLVGVGGSGRKSLAQLSSYIAYMTEYSEVNSKEWVEQVQGIMKVAGLEQKQTIFLFSDTQILRESMVEEVCNILNNGQIPNLFPPEQKAKIIDDITALKPDGSPNEKYQFFVNLCKGNLHMVICMSPVGQDFRRRLRTFPSLVNCTTIDWFLPWPQQALISTADNHFKENMKIKDDVLRKGLVEIAVDMQMRVTKLRNRYEAQLRRYYYVTPTSYLELLSTLQKMLGDRENMVKKQIKRYRDGVETIEKTEAQVSVMQKQLEQLQPQLEKASIENKQLLVNLQANQKQADAKKKVCESEQKECNITRDEANALRADCQSDLDRVLPLLDQASAALDKITQDDMTQLKSYNNPPPAAAIVMEGVCYVFGEDVNVKFTPKEPGSMEKIQDFWSYSKKNLLNAKLITRVKEFREDKIKAIPNANVNKLKQFIVQPDFEQKKVFNASKAAGSLSLWIRAVVDTYGALLVVEPKKKQLAEAEQKLKKAEKQLAEKKAALAEVLELLKKLQEEYKNAKDRQEELKRKVRLCELQLDRASQLIKGLGGEKIAWGKKVIQWQQQKTTVLGDCVLCSGIIAYMGAFPITYRQQTVNQWKQLLKKLNIKSASKFSLQNVLGDPLQIGSWTNVQQLPNDDFSIDNAIIMNNSKRWPLMIDPQIQANNWVKNKEKENKLVILKQTSTEKQIENMLHGAIQAGRPVLLENIGETMDSAYDFILQRKLIKSGASYRIKANDKEIDYSETFRFYMTTKLARPHYSPEICVMVTLLNFQVTLEGLDDQMLNIVVKKEEPIKEQQKQRNIKQFAENKKKQKQTEDVILQLLGSAGSNLLDDETLINTLKVSQKEAEEIAEKMEKLQFFRNQFNNIRNLYKEVSKRVSNLYFITLDLANIQPTYQWSLQFYINLFERAIEKAIVGKQNRCKNIIDKFQSLFYESLCRSLLEKDKLIFSLLICTKILIAEKKITSNQIRFMMVGGTWIQSPEPAPTELDWVSSKIWCTLSEIQKTVDGFTTIIDSFKKHGREWTQIYNSSNPFTQKWPAQWNDVSLFKKLIIIRIIRPDKFSQSLQALISKEIGQEFIEPPPFNLQQAFDDSTCHTPLIFILSPGADPRIEITNLAEKLGFKDNLSSLSLGQGQGEIASKAIKNAMVQGKWVLLQNCHLAPSFMPQLQIILENDQSSHPSFRIWLTSMPSNIFPVTILMKGIKMTYEPPRGLKNNLLRTFGTQNATTFEDCQKPIEWKKMFLGLSFFHALILERRKFGPLGWNIPYEFTAADFAISQSQLKMFLNAYELIPYEALNYMAAEANYGGRVTDPMDRRLIKIILKKFYSPEIMKDDFRMTKDGVYRILDLPTFETSLEYIKNLPINDGTEVFGLHPNAQISSAIIETDFICSTVLALLPRNVSGGGASADQIIKGKIKQILAKIPKPFDTIQASKKHPVKYEESMNTVLQQELFRFNKLLNTVKSTLVNVDKAIDGFVVMSQDLELVFNSIFDNKVPDVWHKVSYPSLKPLGSWVNDFVERLKFMQKWIDTGAPPNFWISGFFFTQSFLTGVLQNFARKYKLPIDTLNFEFDVIGKGPKNFDVSKPPSDGCYIHGLYLDGARWDEQHQCLNQSHNKVLYSKVPYIWLRPTDHKKQITQKQYYICPVYKTSIRRGVLSTTGHSTNYVLSVDLLIEKSTDSDHWVRRGVAMLTQLND